MLAQNSRSDVIVLESQIRVKIVHKLRINRFLNGNKMFKGACVQNASKIQVLKISEHNSSTRDNIFIMNYRKSMGSILRNKRVRG